MADTSQAPGALHPVAARIALLEQFADVLERHWPGDRRIVAAATDLLRVLTGAEWEEAVRLIATTGPLPVADQTPAAEALAALTREAVDAGTYGEPAPLGEQGHTGPMCGACDCDLPMSCTCPPSPAPLGEPVAGQATLATRPEGVEPPPLGGFPAAEPVVDGPGAPGPEQDQDGGDR